MNSPARTLFFARMALFLGLIFAAAAGAEPIRAGGELDFRPYCFTDKNGQLTGFGVDLLKAVADKMGLKLQFIPGPWDQEWNDLAAGKLDVLPVVARTPGRESIVDFGLPHTETFDAFFVRTGRPVFGDLAAAAGRNIVVLRDDAAHHELLERKFSGTIIPVDSIPDGLRLVAAGRHDAFLCSKLIGILEMKEHGIRGLEAGPPIPDYKRVFSFAVSKGNTELLEKLNQGLRIAKTDGTYDRLYTAWLDAETAPPLWQHYAWPLVAVLVVLAPAIVVWRILRQPAEWDERLLRTLTPRWAWSMPTAWRYVLAVGAVAAATALRVALIPWMGTVAPYNITLITVVAATVLFGTGPGLLTVVAGNIAVEVFVVGAWPVMFDGPTVIRLSVSVALGAFVVSILHAARAAVLRARLHAGRLAVFGEATFEGIVLSESDRILDCNEQFAEMLGRTLAELKGGSIADLIPPEDRERVMANIRPNRESVIEHEMLRKDGTRVIVETRGRPVETGGTKRHTAVRDITAYKQAETAMHAQAEQRQRARQAALNLARDATAAHRQAEKLNEELQQEIQDRKAAEQELYELNLTLEKRIQKRTVELTDANRILKSQAELLDLAHDMILVHDLEGRITFWNKCAEKVYGFTAEEALGSITQETLQTQYSEPLLKIISVVSATGYWEGELIHTAKDGRQITIESRWALQRDETGKATAILEIDRDITERKAAEQARREALIYAESIIETIEEALLVLDSDLTVLSANKTFYKLFDETPKSVIGKSLYVLSDGHWQATELRTLLQAVLPEHKTVRGYEIDYPAKNGTRHLVLNAKQISEGRKQPKRILLAIHDVTSHKLQEAVLKELTEELLLAEENQRQQIAVALHDSIGQLLAFSKRELLSLLKELAIPPAGRFQKVIDSINDSISQTRRLTTDLSSPTLNTFGLEAGLEELAEHFTDNFGSSCTFTATKESRPLEKKIQLLLYRSAKELLCNIAKHSNAKKVSIELKNDKGFLELSVSDDGGGFDVSELEVMKNTQQRFGLFSIRHRLHNIGGSFRIHSEKEKGTIAVIRAPLMTAELNKGNEYDNQNCISR